MKKYLVTLLMLASINLAAFASVNPDSISSVLVEETVLVIKAQTGKRISNKNNPFKVSVVTSDGSELALSPIVNKNRTKASVLLPSIPESAGELVKLIIKTSGAKVSEASPQEFVRVLATKPAGFTGDPIDASIAATQASLPAGIQSGIIQQGPKGENGEVGATGPTGPAGARGPEGPVPDNYPGANISGPVNSALTVVNATQSNITTLPNLASIGSGVAETVFTSVVNGTAGFVGSFTGNLAGNVTGDLNGNVMGSSTTFTGSLAGDVTGTQSATTIADSVVTGKQLTSYSAVAGTVTTGDSIQTAISKLDANIQSNDTELSGLSSTVGAATNANTSNAIVQRDANGDFAANIITASSFVGALTGNVTGDLNGNVLGNVSGSAASFTGSLAGDVTGTQSTTFIADSVVTGKELNGGYTSSTGSLANGDTIQNAISKLDGNQQNLTTVLGTPTDASTSGAIVRRDGSGNFAANTITATTFSGNLSGLINAGSSAQPNIQSLTGLENIGSSGVTITVHGPVTANQLITGTITDAQNAQNFNGELMGDVTGPQGATEIADEVVTGKELNGGYTATNGAVMNGDSLQEAIAKIDGNVIDNAAEIALNIIEIGDNALDIADNALDIADNASVIASVNGNVADNTSDIEDLEEDVEALTTSGGDFNGNALTATTAESLLDGSTALSISGDDEVQLVTDGDVDLTLPSENGTLALVGGLTPIAINATSIDIDGTTSIDASGVNLVTVIDNGAGADTLTSITGGVAGQKLTILFGNLVGGTVSITDNGNNAMNTINIENDGASNLFDTNDVIELIYSGTSWFETSRSANSVDI